MATCWSYFVGRKGFEVLAIGTTDSGLMVIFFFFCCCVIVVFTREGLDRRAEDTGVELVISRPPEYPYSKIGSPLLA